MDVKNWVRKESKRLQKFVAFKTLETKGARLASLDLELIKIILRIYEIRMAFRELRFGEGSAFPGRVTKPKSTDVLSKYNL